MRKIVLIGLLGWSINALAQGELVNKPKTFNYTTEIASGIISGYVQTTDKQPAVSVTVLLKENNRTTMTNDEGLFQFLNLKEGVYTLEVSLSGSKTQQKKVEVKMEKTTAVSITLVEDARQLLEVVVTAARRLNNKPVSIGKIEENPMDLPQSVTVVGPGLMKEQQAQRLSDVLKNVAGVYVTTTRGAVQESFGARGYSFGSTNLFKNGARINAGAMPEMSSLEKVEVLKGSAAILYGQVAPGGILNMVTKQPKFKTGGEASMRGGSYDLYKPSFDVYGPVSSVVAYRINGTSEKAGSYRDGVSSTRYYVNPSFLIKLSGQTEILAEGDYLSSRFTPDFGIGSLDNTKIPDAPRSRFLGASWQYNKIQQATATISVKHQFSEAWKLHASFSHQRYKRDYYAVERIQAAANGDWTRPLGKIRSGETYSTAQANLIGKFATGLLAHHFLSGADADRDVTTNNDFSFPSVPGLPAGSYDKINILDPGKYPQRIDVPAATAIRKRIAPLKRFGVYVQDLVKLSSTFNVLVGARWSYVETAGIDSINLLTTAKTKGKTRYDQAFSPRFGLVYKPFGGISFFASYANSFTVNTGQDIYGAVVKPSLINQYELGVKNDLFNGRLSANATAYRIVNNNLAQTAAYLLNGMPNNNTNIKALTGETTSDGVELDLAGEPIKSLQITAGYSYNYMRYTKTDTTAGSYKTGERLVSNPAHTANASVFYTFTGHRLSGGKVGVTVAYTGDRFGGYNNVVGQSQTYSRLIPVPGFTTIDVSAGYLFKRISLLAKVSNITNTLNWYVHENYSINPIPPTQFIATVSYKF